MKKTKKKKTGEAELTKLVRLTQLIKQDKVEVVPKAFPRGVNKWRSYEPKFEPKTAKSENVVEAGGMKVDPSLKDAYELWRQDKIAEQNERRAQSLRKWEAAKAARQARNAAEGSPPTK
jgi:hypothetical protein